jgi:hypothetical protein
VEAAIWQRKLALPSHFSLMIEYKDIIALKNDLQNQISDINCSKQACEEISQVFLESTTSGLVR